MGRTASTGTAAATGPEGRSRGAPTTCAPRRGGDTIKVVFRNGCSVGVSVHPHGVFYREGSEGAPYADGTSGKER
jgi:hypothetical protein